jgi:L-phenylalanine/L-methionine N-acetyltransferase
VTIHIRRAKSSDAAAIARMSQDPAVFGGLLQLPYTTEEIWRERIERASNDGSADIMLVAELDGVVAGNAGLHGASLQVRRRHVLGLGISVALEHQGKGVGSALMAALTDYADHWAHVLRLELSVYTDNAHAIALYKKFGFVQEGVHRAYALRGGRYVDTVSMARLHPNPPELPKP